MAVRLAVIFALGALQGFVGWFMVASGLVNRPSVSQYRLAMHLALAVLIYGTILWTALGLVRRPAYGAAETWVDGLRRGAGFALAMDCITMVSGAFVAGLRDGLYYNTFPLMSGELVPHDYLANTPWWLNPFQNIPAVQFDHRLLAYCTVATILVFWGVTWRARLARHSRVLVNLMAAMVLIQATLGVETLLNYVPVWLGSLHQASALTLFTVTLITLHDLRRLPHKAVETAG
jgi:cytochrome c oxidase assembly protein subunit 15